MDGFPNRPTGTSPGAQQVSVWSERWYALFENYRLLLKDIKWSWRDRTINQKQTHEVQKFKHTTLTQRDKELHNYQKQTQNNHKDIKN